MATKEATEKSGSGSIGMEAAKAVAKILNEIQAAEGGLKPDQVKENPAVAWFKRMQKLAEKLNKTKSEESRLVLMAGERVSPKVYEAISPILRLTEAEFQSTSGAVTKKVAENLFAMVQEGRAGKIDGKSMLDAQHALAVLGEKDPYVKVLYLQTAGVSGGMATTGPTFEQQLREAVDDLYKTTGDTVTDVDLREELVGLQRVLRGDPRGFDAKSVDEARRVALKMVKDSDDPQAKEMLKRIYRVETIVSQKTHAAHLAESGRTGSINAKDLREKYGIRNPLRQDSDPELTFRELTQEEIESILTRGYDGMDEWLSKLEDDIVGMGPDMGRKELKDIYKFDEFTKLVTFAFPEDQAYRLNVFKARWDKLGRIDAAVRHVINGTGPLEDKLKYMRETPADFQEAVNVEYFEHAWGLMGEGVRDVIARERVKHNIDRSFLLARVNGNLPIDNPYFNPAATHDMPNIAELLKKKQITNMDLLHILRAKMAEGTPDEMVANGKLKPGHAALLAELEIKFDNVNRGVFLRDEHMLNQGAVYQNLAQEVDKYHKLRAENPQSPELAKLEKRIRKLWGDYTKNPDEWRGPDDQQDLSDLYGYSPVEIHLHNLLKVKFKELGVHDPRFRNVPEWKIRKAVKNARNLAIASGEAAVIGARMAIRAGEFGPYRTQDQMNRAHLEALQRIINPEWFMEDFGMGGEQGKRARTIWNMLIMKYKGGVEFMNDPEWKKFCAQANTTEDKRFVEMMKFAQSALGTDFSELIRTGFLRGGLQFDQTSWRLNVAVLQELRKFALERYKEEGKPPGEILDNMGAGLQLLCTGLGKENWPLRRKLMLRIMQREPSLMFQMLGKDMDNILTNILNINPDSAEWRKFKDALVISQQKLWDDDKFAYRVVNLAKKEDFDEVVGKTMTSMGMTEGHEKYRQAIVEMQKYMNSEFKGDTRLEYWATHDWPMTLTLSDFNMRKADFMKLGVYSMERRINDFVGMSKAMGAMFELMYDSKYWSPQGEKGITEMLGKIKEMEGAISGYESPETAAKAGIAMLHLMLELNRNRAIWKIGWIPGGITLAKGLAELDLRWLAHNKVLNKLSGGAWERLAGEKIHHWPHSVAEWLSYSVAFTGGHGNDWGEAKMLDVIDQAETMGLALGYKDLIHDLKNEMKVTLPWRTMAMFRRYWWVPFVASAALAVAQATDDEKKKSEKGG